MLRGMKGNAYSMEDLYLTRHRVGGRCKACSVIVNIMQDQVLNTLGTMADIVVVQITNAEVVRPQPGQGVTGINW